jgi:hypothetical protein
MELLKRYFMLLSSGLSSLESLELALNFSFKYEKIVAPEASELD